jgi:uncharacterized protein (TIGR03382 family)
MEVRSGMFTNVSQTLSLTVKNGDYGTVTIDPDLLDDETNIDPNEYDPPIDPDELRRYTDGTEIVLVAEAIEGKSFRTWKIYDPNHPGDANYVESDNNAVLYLTMNADYQVEAIFKCSSSTGPVLLLAVGLLGMLALVRRRSSRTPDTAHCA